MFPKITVTDSISALFPFRLCVSLQIVFTCWSVMLFCPCRGTELRVNAHQQRHAWRMAFSLIRPTGESDIQSDNWGIDRSGVSGDIDKCVTEGLVSDGEDGCQRDNQSISTGSSTPHWPLFSCLFYPVRLYFLSSVCLFPAYFCFHLLFGSMCPSLASVAHKTDFGWYVVWIKKKRPKLEALCVHS